ncbi:transcription elongation factor greA [Candidatus Vecturithrix granuli]|uniref:Transcription elongation factor greA n=1 Tax=Vecturithrix granuli TaxID=1499967 RepID=A0A081C3Z1_VECG1|nr:transcription elongation factor greA [Candidatus Vecturithrix granuli]
MEKYTFTLGGYIKFKKQAVEFERKLKILQSQTAETAEIGGDLWHDNFSYEQLQIQIRAMDTRLAESQKILNNARIIFSPESYEYLKQIENRLNNSQNQEPQLFRSKLQEIRGISEKAIISNLPEFPERVAIGCKVCIGIEEEEQVWTIVGYGEAEPESGKIAYNAPLSKAIIGAEVGDVRRVNIGGKNKKIEVFEISQDKEVLQWGLSELEEFMGSEKPL